MLDGIRFIKLLVKSVNAQIHTQTTDFEVQWPWRLIIKMK